MIVSLRDNDNLPAATGIVNNNLENPYDLVDSCDRTVNFGTVPEGWSSTASSFKAVFEKQLASLINSDAFKK